MVFEPPQLAAEIDELLAEAMSEYNRKRQWKAMERQALKSARDAGKAARHSAREHRREV